MTASLISTRLSQLAVDLPAVDLPRSVALVEQHGYYGAARIMGYDISHYDNLLLAGRMAIEDLRHRSPATLLDYVMVMGARLNPDVAAFFLLHEEELQRVLDKYAHLDYEHNWFSANTIITTYSTPLATGEPGIERPQHIWLRVAAQFYHRKGVQAVIRTFLELAEGWYTPASPTIFNAGTAEPQMISCFLLPIEDSLQSILKMGICKGAFISKSSGGLGLDISRVRHSEISSSGESSGIIPMIQLYNSMVRYVDQKGRRKGAATIFLRPHHLDVEDFVDLPRKVGDRYQRAHDINICLWTSWIFWQRVQEDGIWTLFCPAKTPQLNDVYGEEFTRRYVAAENDPTILPRHRKTISARELYKKIIDVQRETGMPYLMNGDAANLKSNQRNLGYIRCSNLCLEIIEYTDEQNIASCNLHSLSLRMYGRKAFNFSAPDTTAELRACVDFAKLGEMTRAAVRNLNEVIDGNKYPLDKIKDGVHKLGPLHLTNKRHRPVGLGASGFAELLYILNLPFEDERTRLLNKMLFACIYWNALVQSTILSSLHGPYESFPGSPTAQGLLQFDLWKEEFAILGPNKFRQASDDEPLSPETWGQTALQCSNLLVLPTWESVKENILRYGLRNSLLTALMPTASTAQIRCNCESVEPHQNNMYSRKVLKCSYPVLSRYLLTELEKLGIWNTASGDYIRGNNGSVANLCKYVENHPHLFPQFSGEVQRLQHCEQVYRTVWEISQKWCLQLAADRGRYIDQSQSTNIYLQDCTSAKLNACHIVSNMLGLKTNIYYLRQTGGETIKFTAEPESLKYIQNLRVEEAEKERVVCTDDVCTSCT